jgi:predicted DNA-binding protein YlxM (UPF0122 family)
MEQMRDDYSVNEMAETLEISMSGLNEAAGAAGKGEV